MMISNPKSRKVAGPQLQTEFFREYTSPEAISKYSRSTAGYGIAYLLEHDYKSIYLDAIDLLPSSAKECGLRILEFGCGTGMNLLHLMSVLRLQGIRVGRAVGTDFSPVLIETAKAETNNGFVPKSDVKVDFVVAKNQTLLDDISTSLTQEPEQLPGSFDFIFGVNTIRYCHASGQQLECAAQIFKLLAPGGICVVIDMNDRFPAFRSDLKNKFRWHKEEECYVPSLDEYAQPFSEAGFELLRKENFCWVPHSSGQLLCAIMLRLSPLFSAIAPSRAMRSLVVARKAAN